MHESLQVSTYNQGSKEKPAPPERDKQCCRVLLPLVLTIFQLVARIASGINQTHQMMTYSKCTGHRMWAQKGRRLNVLYLTVLI
jgi:hypothetical protein